MTARTDTETAARRDTPAPASTDHCVWDAVEKIFGIPVWVSGLLMSGGVIVLLLAALVVMVLTDGGLR